MSDRVKHWTLGRNGHGRARQRKTDPGMEEVPGSARHGRTGPGGAMKRRSVPNRAGRSMHTGKLRQQHEFTNASFIILVRCHFVSPYHVDRSANNVLCRGGHFCEIAGIIAH